MKNPLSRTPFLALLIPLIAGILLQYFLRIQYLSIAFSLMGILTMLFSYLVSVNKQYQWRWIFGAGACLFLIGVGIISTSFRQQKSEFTFSDQAQTYIGIVTDSPQDKPRTTAYKVYLPDENKQIVCYIQPDLIQEKLQPGEIFLFHTQIQPFKNMGNPDDFDYVRYMYNQGFAGSAYISNNNWKTSGQTTFSLKYKALQYRQRIMDFYRSLDFSDTEYSILCALTLGYQDELTDELKQGFRTTGTVHVLSVSGLHVGIIYLMISFLLGFIKRRSEYYWLKPLLIIVFLWTYAYITGLPTSVVRASTMLSVFCIAEILEKRSYSIHALFIAAFFMLLVNPFSLFEIGFQLSFMSVLAILLLHPRVSKLIKTKNKPLRHIWQLFTLSLVAQLATFPLCLYYFGTFPTYFFVTNILIVPLVSLITYAVGGVVLAKLISLALPDIGDYLFYLPVKILQILVHLMTSIIHFFENLPVALIDNIKISFTELILIFTIIIAFVLFFIYKKSKSLILGLSCILIFCTIGIYKKIQKEPDQLIVYNRARTTEIRYKTEIWNSDNLDNYKLFEAGNHKVLVLKTNVWNDKNTDNKFEIDHLILTNDNNLSMYNLSQLLDVKNVIIDASLSAYTRRKISKECQKLNIPCHDVIENGAFSLNF